MPRLAFAVRSACIALALIAAPLPASSAAPSIAITLGTPEPITPPPNLPSLPDEHTTIFPPAAGSPAYRFFGASSTTGGTSGTVVLQTTDLKTFSPAAGYAAQVMTSQLALRTCNPTYDTEFDENYAAAGSVVQDPTLPPGNLIMIYEAENHCPGGQPQYPFYATVGFMRSSDNGKTWPAPVNAQLGNANRYPVLISSSPQPMTLSQVAIGNAIPSAIVDGNYLYVTYISLPAPPAIPDNKLRMARGLLGSNGQVTFTKWNNGSWSTPGRGGDDSAILQAGACVGSQGMPSVYNYDPLGIYVLIFVCRNQPQQKAGWYFSTATSLDAQDWSAPQLIPGSESLLQVPCPEAGNADGQQFDGSFPSFMSPGAQSGHIGHAGYAFYGTGCNTDKRGFARRSFVINVAGTNAPNVDQHGLTGSWYEPATSGQGIEVEIFPDNVAQGSGTLQGSWFTFDTASGGADHGRWYTFGGSVFAGDTAGVFTMYQNVGGNFDAAPVTSATVVGHATMSFSDCTDALLNYTFTDGTARTGSVVLTRLTLNVNCAQSASTAGNGDFGLSGNWYDAATSGQGIVVELNSVSKVMFLAWYTYAVNGQALGATGQRWFTGLAQPYAAGSRSIPFVLRETTGGVFNQSPPSPTTAQVGTGTLTFTSCSAATLAFNFTSGSNAGHAGNIALTRVGPTPSSCVF